MAMSPTHPSSPPIDDTASSATFSSSSDPATKLDPTALANPGADAGGVDSEMEIKEKARRMSMVVDSVSGRISPPRTSKGWKTFLSSYIDDNLMLDPRLFVQEPTAMVNLNAAAEALTAPSGSNASKTTSTPSPTTAPAAQNRPSTQPIPNSNPSSSKIQHSQSQNLPYSPLPTPKSNEMIPNFNFPSNMSTGAARPGPDTPITEDPNPMNDSSSGGENRDYQDPNIPNIAPGKETHLPVSDQRKAIKKKRARSEDERDLAKRLGQSNAARVIITGDGDNSGESDDRTQRSKRGSSFIDAVNQATSSRSSATMMQQSSTNTSEMESTVKGEPRQRASLTGRELHHRNRLQPPHMSTHRPGINPLRPGTIDEIGGNNSWGSGGSKEIASSSSAAGAVITSSSEGAWQTPDDKPSGPVDETERVQRFFEANGFLCAPKQSPSEVRRRLRMIRRLGLDRPGQPIGRDSLDKFTRLACSVFNVKIASVTIIGKHKQLFVSEMGLGQREMDTDLGLCTHTALSGTECMVINEVAKDWRFANHPMVCNGSGPIQAYCGAPLIVSRGKHPVTIGSFCVIDMKPRPDFDDRTKAVMMDLASCVVADLEQMYQVSENRAQQSMHQVTVDFLRQSLQAGTTTRKDHRSKAKSEAVAAGNVKDHTTVAEENGENDTNMDLFEEACRIVRDTLHANACAIIDASNFHVFYPINSTNRSNHGSSSGTGTDSGTGTGTGTESRSGDTDSLGGYSSENSFLGLSGHDRRTARNLVNLQSRALAPTVQFVPKRRRHHGFSNEEREDNEKGQQIRLLGSATSSENMSFSFQSPEAKRVVAEFITLNLKSRKTWFERDDSKAIANSINAVMPPGTASSLAMPIFDYEGQCAFVFVACWTDDLYTYNSSALSFVESICGTLMATSQRSRMAAIEQSQRLFASLANHELRTPMHQMLASTALLRDLTAQANSVESSHLMMADELKKEIGELCDTLDSSGRSLDSLLNDVLDFLDVGGEHAEERDMARKGPQKAAEPMENVMSEIILEAWEMEARNRGVTGGSMEDLEVFLEIMPREAGSWQLDRDKLPLQRAVLKLLINAFQCTPRGFIAVICEDISRKTHAPRGYQSAMPTTMVSITIEDSGIGMDQEFIDNHIFKPFAKANVHAKGAGLGVPLASRMIDLMGGTIGFQSTAGSGTSVKIEVPLSIDSDGAEHSSSEERERKQARVHLLGFRSKDGLALSHMAASIKRQLRNSNCIVVRSIGEADVVVVEESCDLGPHAEELHACANDTSKRIVMFGAATSEQQPNPPSSIRVGDFDLPVGWVFRPLLPSVLDKIVDTTRCRFWPPSTGTESDSPAAQRSGTSRMINPDTTTTESDSDADREKTTPPAKATLPEPALSDPNLADLKHERPPLGPRSETSVSIAAISHDATDDMEPSEAVERDAESPAAFKVLVVEDNVVNRRLLVGALKKMGIHVAEAVDGEDGISEYTLFKPGLVLLDINMPRKNGFEAAIAIRAYEAEMKWPRCKIIAVTALQGPLNEHRGLIEAGIDEWITKPVSIRRLRQDVSELRKQYQARS